MIPTNQRETYNYNPQNAFSNTFALINCDFITLNFKTMARIDQKSKIITWIHKGNKKDQSRYGKHQF